MNTADLQKFCAPEDDIRFYLCHPYSLGPCTYATDGHIIIRVPRLADVPENDRAPNPEKLFAESPSAKKWVPVPECAMPALVPCSYCKGTGKEISDKRYKCEGCDGKKLVPDIESHCMIVHAGFAQRFLALIQGWEISPSGPNLVARIRNGEADGLLMPIRLPS